MSKWRVLKSNALRAGLAVCASTVVMLAVAAVKPNPPSKLCIGGNCATSTPTVAGNIKWHPGHYVWVSGPGYSSKVQTATMGVLNNIANDPSVAGIQIVFKWAELEGDKAGDYSAGFAMIDGLLAKLASLPTPKRLIINFNERTYGSGTSTIPGGVFPAYIAAMGGVILAPPGSNWAGLLQSVAKLDNPAVIDRLIALAQAYGARYDSNPLVEMYVPMSELAVSPSAGIDGPTYVAGVKRLYAAAAQAWPTTLLRWQLNFAPSDPHDQVMLSLMAAARAIPQSVIGGPDPEVPLPLPANYPTGVRTIQGNRVFRGLGAGSGSTVVYEDLRGKIPWVGEYQGGAVLGAGYVLPEDFGSYEVNVMHASYIIYCYNTWAPSNTGSDDPHKWAAQHAYIDSIKGAVSDNVAIPGK